MNHDEVMKLTEEQLLQTVLNEQGWRTYIAGITIWVNRDGEEDNPPDYLHDLNADFDLVEGRRIEIRRYPDGLSVVRLDGVPETSDFHSLSVAILRAYLLSKEV